MPVIDYLSLPGELLSYCVDGGTPVSLLSDPLGSVVGETGSSSYRTYRPYGETRAGDASVSYGYVGTLGYRRDDPGLTYVRARHYRPRTGRWQTVDPLWPEEMAYGYVGGNPTGSVDYWGLACNSMPCPASVISGMNQAANSIDRLVAADTWGGGAIARRITRCIAAKARALGIVCPSFDSDTLRCMKSSFLGTPILCSECKDSPGTCAFASGQYPNASITICLPAASGPGCGNAWIPPPRPSVSIWVSVIHELLHTCGFGHGLSKEPPGGEPPAPVACNEIAVKCIRDALQGAGK